MNSISHISLPVSMVGIYAAPNYPSVTAKPNPFIMEPLFHEWWRWLDTKIQSKILAQKMSTTLLMYKLFFHRKRQAFSDTFESNISINIYSNVWNDKTNLIWSQWSEIWDWIQIRLGDAMAALSSHISGRQMIESQLSWRQYGNISGPCPYYSLKPAIQHYIHDSVYLIKSETIRRFQIWVNVG